VLFRSYTPSDWNDDYLADFSAAGPTLDGFVKPDLLAPGAHMTSTMLKGSYIARNHEANWVDGQYFSMAGTSQAAAVVSGVAALVLDHNPGLTPNQVKYRLMITSLPWINAEQTDVLYSVWQQGFGRVNAYDAVYAQVDGYANRGMDIQADLAGPNHYEGYSYFDEQTGLFRLHGYEDMTSGFGAWAGNYGTWSGGFGAWADGFGAWADGFGAWADGFGAWADGFGAWADGFGAWADGFGAWAGGFGAWAGGFGAWAGGFGAWAGGFGAWAGGFGAWAGRLLDPAFIADYTNGVAPNASTTTATIHWVQEK
jgi:serine protease AprX